MKIKIILMLLIATVCLTSCVGENLVNDYNDTSKNDNKDDKNETDKGTIQGDNKLTYIVEPKETYDPNNKIAVIDVYGKTEEEKNYYFDLVEKDRKITDRDKKMSESNINIFENVKNENMYNIGDKLSIDEYKCKLTVNDVKVYDSIEGFDKDYFFDSSYTKDAYIDNSGKIKKFIRNQRIYDENGEIVSNTSKNVNIKFVVVSLSLEGESEWVTEFPICNINLIPMVKNGDYYEDYYRDVAKEKNGICVDYKYEPSLNFDNGPYYFDKAIFTKKANRSHFFFTYITKGEKIDFNLGYYVDEEWLNNMYLYYTEDCIFTDSILQKGVKLFE